MSSAIIENKLTVDGIDFPTSVRVSFDGVLRKEKVGNNALAVAKIGQLTTRTDNNTGVLTMAGGHGFQTGDRLDIYWSGGARRGVTVGTVATNSVPFDLGDGDNLPDNLTAITAQVPLQEELFFTGANAQFIAGKGSRRGIIVLTEADDAEALAMVIDPEVTDGNGYQWYEGNGRSNPLAGIDVAKVYFSNGDSANTNAMTAVAGVN